MPSSSELPRSPCFFLPGGVLESVRLTPQVVSGSGLRFLSAFRLGAPEARARSFSERGLCGVRDGVGVTHCSQLRISSLPPPTAYAMADAENKGLEGGREAPCHTCPPTWSSSLPLVVGGEVLPALGDSPFAPREGALRGSGKGSLGRRFFLVVWVPQGSGREWGSEKGWRERGRLDWWV